MTETTAVSKLKASLSHYLAKIKAGEDALVTERRKPIDKIIPVHRDTTDIPVHLLLLNGQDCRSSYSGNHMVLNIKLARFCTELSVHWPNTEKEYFLNLKKGGLRFILFDKE